MYRICLISKYPPIEGGESAKAYWLARGLGKRGHEVHVVTNALEVENEYRERLEGEDLNLYQPPGVSVHNTDPFANPFYIPFTKPYAAKLANQAIEVIRDYDLELIDSWYVLPYVISAFLTKTFTDKPQIMRHAGSDMTRLLRSPELNTLFLEVFQRVDMVVTYPGMTQRFRHFGVADSNIYLNKVSVDTEAFNPSATPLDVQKLTGRSLDDLPIVTYAGKIATSKGIFELIQALSLIKREFLFLVVTSNRNAERLKDEIARHGLEEKTALVDFLPPWKMPSLFRASTCVVMPERDFPIGMHTPILPREVMATGGCAVISEELYHKRRSEDIQDGVHTVVVNPYDIEEFASKLRQIITRPEYAQEISVQAWRLSERLENFEEYLDITEAFYGQLVDRDLKDSQSGQTAYAS